MRLPVALAATLMLAGTSLATECTLENARYSQTGASWLLKLKPVPDVAPANQIAAFEIELPGSGVALEGAIHVPNGFGSPLWALEGPCGPDSSEICSFLEDFGAPAVYGSYDGKLQFLETERRSAAPEQFLLPGLAVSLWYSNYRLEWDGDAMPGDAFILEGCD